MPIADEQPYAFVESSVLDHLQAMIALASD